MFSPFSFIPSYFTNSFPSSAFTLLFYCFIVKLIYRSFNFLNEGDGSFFSIRQVNTRTQANQVPAFELFMYLKDFKAFLVILRR